MTIDEAKTKICPFMVEYTFEANDCTATKYKNCICGDCMAWEWETIYKNQNRLPPLPIGKSTTNGYCKRIEK